MIHFSHSHELVLVGEIGSESVYQSSLLMLPICSCCKLPASPEEPMYCCLQCNYGLHSSCAQFPHLLNLPGHRNHTLALLPTSAYPGGTFNCDACNRRGDGFSYHCSSCEYDLHVTCASKPLQITLLHFHPCPLDLTFKSPYENAKGFSCDVCRKMGMKEWLYRCAACEFDVHLDCAALAGASAAAVLGGEARVLHAAGMGGSGQPHSHHASLMGHHQIVHGANPIAQNPSPPAPAVSVHGQVVRPDGNVHGGRSVQRGNNFPPPRGQSGLVVNPVIQGLLGGGAQGVGQGLVQGLIGGCHSGGGGGGDVPSITGTSLESHLDHNFNTCDALDYYYYT